MNPKALYWIDLETTGLDPNEDRILEIALARAPFNRPFDLTKLGSWVFSFKDWSDVSDRIIDMHHKNGLLLECIKSKLCDAPNSSQREHDMTILLNKALEPYKNDWIDDENPNAEMTSDKLPVLAGSSVHFDRGFLRVDVPDFAKKFSHRLYDISALKLFCRSAGMTVQYKAEAHRAWDDILESVQHTKECAAWLGCSSSELRRLFEPMPF